MPFLTVENLRKDFADTPILRGIDVDLAGGEITVLIGPNGAGKTLCLNCIGGGLAPTSGRIRINNCQVTAKTRRSMNLLLQDSMLLDHLTGRENIEFYHALHPAASSRCLNLVRTFGLESALPAKTRDYSGGMVRKLELAITLGADVPIYLLDEPTSGLDLTAITTVHETLLTERDRGKAILLSTHVPLDMDIADTILFLRDGKITATGCPATLREDLPSVVRITGSIGRLTTAVTKHFRSGHLFERGDEARGFVSPTSDLEQITRSIDELSGTYNVTRDPPTYVDLFNYYAVLTETTGVAQ